MDKVEWQRQRWQLNKKDKSGWRQMKEQCFLVWDGEKNSGGKSWSGNGQYSINVISALILQINQSEKWKYVFLTTWAEQWGRLGKDSWTGFSNSPENRMQDWLVGLSLTAGQLVIGTHCLGRHSTLPFTQAHNVQFTEDHMSPSCRVEVTHWDQNISTSIHPSNQSAVILTLSSEFWLYSYILL